MKFQIYVLLAFVLSVHSLVGQSLTSKQSLTNFTMQASVLVNEQGDHLSDPAYRPPVHWFPVKVPTTVLSGLVANKVYPNPSGEDENKKYFRTTT